MKSLNQYQLDFSYNASFASQNVAKVMMKENELPYSMASFKEIMAFSAKYYVIYERTKFTGERVD